MSENALSNMPILAFDFGGTRGRCGLASPEGHHAHVAMLERQPDEDGAAWLARLLATGKTVRANARNLQAVAISFGGPVTPEGRVVSTHVSGWEKVDLRQQMKLAFGVPVHIENDGNAGAVGEHRFGAGRGTRHMAYFTVSTGIGGGVVLDGKLYRGAHGLAGEFGHMVMHPGPNAPQYAAGKPGVLEALASGPAIAREGRAALQRLGRNTAMGARLDALTCKDVFAAAEAGEVWAIVVRDEAIAHLARGVAAVICAYDVELVVIGGGVSQAGEALFGPLRAAVNRYLPYYQEGKPRVVQASLGDAAPMLGAVAATADEVLRK
ncbi:MAG TPA: ROK family protein [Planctomycetota bacterium]